MFWLSHLLKPNKVEKRHYPSIHNPKSRLSAWVSRIFGTDTENITKEDVFGLSPVWRAIRVISEPIATIGFNHYKKESNGDIILQESELNRLLSKSPSAFYSSFTWRETFMTHILITGNAYIHVLRNGGGQVQEFRLIDPHYIEDIIAAPGGLIYHIVGMDKPIPARDMIHIPGLGFNGLVGKNPIEVHRETLLIDKSSRDYAKNFYSNGAFLSGVLSSPAALSDDAYRRMKNSWQDAYGGSKNAGRTPILEEGTTFAPIRLSPLDAGWVETRDKVVEEVSRIYGVPMHMLSALERSTFNNIEHQSLELTKYTLIPWMARVEAEFNRKLFPRSENEFVRFDKDQLMMGDVESMTKFIEAHFKMGNLNTNEIRRKYLNLNGVEHGNTYFIQGNNMIPVDKAINMEPVGMPAEEDEL